MLSRASKALRSRSASKMAFQEGKPQTPGAAKLAPIAPPLSSVASVRPLSRSRDGWQWLKPLLGAVLAESTTAVPVSSPLWRMGAVAFMVGRALGRERKRGRNGSGKPSCGMGFIRRRPRPNDGLRVLL